jgi:hypothetical protein
MGAEVRVKKDVIADFEVVGHGEIVLLDAISDDGGQTLSGYLFAGTKEGVGPASLASLREAMLTWRQGPRRDATLPIELALSDVHEEDFYPMDGISISPSLFLSGERLLVRVATSPSPPPDPTDLRRLFTPYLERRGASCHDVVVEKAWDPFARPGDEFWSAAVLIDWPIDGRTVAEAWSFGEEAHSLLRAAGSGELTQANALDLLRGGTWDLFLGQPESEWLDAKQAPYLGSNDIWKNELAKDVAAFANRPGGGLIVLGMRTARKGELDVIEEVNQIDLGLVSAERYRKVVGDWVYPEVDGFAIEPIQGATEGRGLVALIVPPQPRNNLPFLVKGMVKDGKVRDHYILLPFRRADETAFGDIASIHVRLRLGQQALDAEGPPRSDD